MPTPSLPSVITPVLLSSIRSTPKLPHHCWYYVTGVTLSALNRPDEIPGVLEYALKNGVGSREQSAPSDEEQLKIARRMREGLVKSAAVVGLPKTINALLALKRSTPPNLLDPPLTTTPTRRSLDVSSDSASSVLRRGAALFDAIYGKISARVMGQMDNSGTEDLGLVARVAYGYILSGGMDVLGPVETSWVLLAGLVPQDVNPQLKGHLKGAVNNGATVDEVRAVRGLSVRICEEAGMRVLDGNDRAAWGWTEEVENLKQDWVRKGKL